jgi:hypothetical protein
MDWFFSIIRVAGASFPVASSFVQLQAELDSKILQKRLSRLEDPVSFLHEDVPELSKHIYNQLKSKESIQLSFSDEFYAKYSRALASLESQSYIKGGHAIGKRYAAGIRLIDPSYIMYLCALEEDNEKMETLVKIVDSCEAGKWLDGNRLQMTISLPLVVIKAVFEIFESKGYGLCSKTIGETKYIGKA